MAHIKTYARIKPTQRKYSNYDHSNDTLHLRVPENLRDLGGYSVRLKSSFTNHEFKFGHLFPPCASQEEVFNTVARDIVQGFLTGYNGTVFAYGQTGSGKTFTVQGSARRYEDRGLAHRAISRIYQELAARQDEEISIYVSYMEIYQEIGYDLLSTAARTSLVATFPKVAVVEGPNGSCLVRNLSTHLAANEDVAQNLLLQGQANRKVAETPMNQRSSRSHAIFTIQLRAKKPGSDVIMRSKLHLVDLAGSERVSKTGVEGAQLSEAKFINLSLHHLESVIIALQQQTSGSKARPKTPNAALYNSWANSMRPSSASSMGGLGSGNRHIPYRNSLLTMLLRDSLGGNCQTAMIATISMEEENLSETISTCRFSQRVACITNVLRKNEEIDDRAMVRRLRKRIAELEAEVSMLRAGQGSEAAGLLAVSHHMSEEDQVDCIRIMQGYLTGRISDPISAGVTTTSRFRESLRILRTMILKHYGQSGDIADQSQLAITESSSPASIDKNKLSSDSNQRPPLHPLHVWKDNNKPAANKDAERHSDELNEGREKPKTHRVLPPRPSTSSLVKNARKVAEGMVGQIEGSDQVLVRVVRQGSGRTSRVGPRLGSAESFKSSGSQNKRPGSSSSTSSHTSEALEPKPQPSRDTYKSPFERKREKEIMKLNRKVSEMNNIQKEEKEHLAQVQASLKEQRLQIIGSEIKNKLHATKTQLNAQHAYVLDLKNTGADPDFIQQEKVVMKQLKKGVAKMERRLAIVDEQLQILQQGSMKIAPGSLENDSRSSRPSRSSTSRASGHAGKATLEEQFPHHVRRDGKINTRQVLEKLQQQDKKQEKTRAQIELQQVVAIHQQIEVKEAATRQKLAEFREKLKQASLMKKTLAVDSETDEKHDHSQETEEQDHVPRPSHGPGPLAQLNGLHSSSVSSSSDEEMESGRVSRAGFRGEYPKFKMNSPTRNNENITASSPVELAGGNNQRYKDTDCKSVHTLSEQSHDPMSKADINLYTQNSGEVHSTSAKPRQGSASSQQSVTNRWEEVYSSKTSEWNPAASTPNTEFALGISRSVVDDTSSRLPGYEDIPEVDLRSLPNSSFGESSEDSLSDLEPASKAMPIIMTPIDGATSSGPLIVPSGGVKHSTPTSSGSSMGRTPSGSLISQENIPPDRWSGSSIGFQSSSCASTSDDSRNKLKMSQTNSVNLSQYMPSEYVDQEHSESFDARKMSLNHKTFESALDSMLGIQPEGPLTYRHEEYDKFARSKRQNQNNVLHQSSSSISSSRPNIKQPVPRPRTSKVDKTKSIKFSSVQLDARTSLSAEDRTSMVPWGPDAKNASISERLTEFLEMDPFQHTAKRNKIGSSFEDSDLTFKKPAVAEDAATHGPSGDWRKNMAKDKPKPDLDLDNYAPKIKAMPEEEREDVFIRSARQQRDRVQKIRQAQRAAELIQNTWKQYKNSKGEHR